MTDARIQFKTLKGFPEAVDKIETQVFLNAAKEIVTVIGKPIDRSTHKRCWHTNIIYVIVSNV